MKRINHRIMEHSHSIWTQSSPMTGPRGRRSWGRASHPLRPRRTAPERLGMGIAGLIGVALLVAVVALAGPVRSLAHAAVPDPDAGHAITATVIPAGQQEAGAPQMPGIGLEAETLQWRWAGQRHTERLYVDTARPPGGVVEIRVDDRGLRIPDPVMDLDATTLTAFLLLAAAGAAAGIAAATLRGLRWWLLQCRLRAWDEEWDRLDAARDGNEASRS
jgi:hypothetical protein